MASREMNDSYRPVSLEVFDRKDWIDIGRSGRIQFRANREDIVSSLKLCRPGQSRDSHIPGLIISAYETGSTN